MTDIHDGSFSTTGEPTCPPKPVPGSPYACPFSRRRGTVEREQCPIVPDRGVHALCALCLHESPGAHHGWRSSMS
jgi:hypothetical protein